MKKKEFRAVFIMSVLLILSWISVLIISKKETNREDADGIYYLLYRATNGKLSGDKFIQVDPYDCLFNHDLKNCYLQKIKYLTEDNLDQTEKLKLAIDTELRYHVVPIDRSGNYVFTSAITKYDYPCILNYECDLTYDLDIFENKQSAIIDFSKRPVTCYENDGGNWELQLTETFKLYYPDYDLTIKIDGKTREEEYTNFCCFCGG